MNKMKLILTLAALFTVAAQPTSAQTGVAYWSAYGTGGCIGGARTGYYTASVNWKHPSAPNASALKGGVNFKEYAGDDAIACTSAGLTGKRLRVIYLVKTAQQEIPTIIAFDPKNKTVKYASKGSCAPTLTTNMYVIIVTVTETRLTIECPELNYRAEGTTNHPIAFSRYR